MAYYERLAALKTSADLYQVREEIFRRFGLPPGGYITFRKKSNTKFGDSPSTLNACGRIRVWVAKCQLLRYDLG